MLHQYKWLLTCCRFFTASVVVVVVASALEDSHDQRTPSQEAPCGLYLAESPLTGRLSLFAGTHRVINERIGSSDALISMIDPNMNEWSPWHEFGFSADNLLEHVLLENQYLHEILVTGLTACIPCATTAGANVIARGLEEVNDSPAEQPLHPAAGSFTQRPSLVYRALQPLEVGDELVLYCQKAKKNKSSPPRKTKENTTKTTGYYGGYNELWEVADDDEDDDDDDDDHEEQMLLFASQKSSRPVEWLQENGACVDYLYPDRSTTPLIGRGAFSRRHFAEGDVVTSSPVVYMDISQLDILKQAYKKADEHFLPMHRAHGIEYTDQVVGQQLLTNYVFGHPDSNLVLFPIAPTIHWINHGNTSTDQEVNARLAWSVRFKPTQRLWDMPIMELLETPVGEKGEYFVIDVVALRDIAPGEEIRIDYGADWKKAWEAHEQEWRTREHDTDPVPAGQIMEHDEPIKTVVEQQADPYPDNLQTACIYGWDDDEMVNALNEEGQDKILEWSSTNGQRGCLRPCDILTRTEIGDGGEVYYTATIYPIENIRQPEHCGHLPEYVMVRGLPWEIVTLVDKAYAGIAYQPTAFRHVIGVPDDLFPSHWIREDPKTTVSDFITDPLLPAGHLAPLRWSNTREAASSWSFRIGLPSQMHNVLLDYCNKMGITDVLRHCTAHGNGLLTGRQGRVELRGQNWLLQRPHYTWRSNLHWLSPLDNFAHEDYLQALSAAGFDLILEGLAQYLNLQHLVVYEMSFIGVSFSNKGFLHHDFIDTGNKTFNILVPIYLANEAAPELDIMHGDGFPDDYFKPGFPKPRVGRYKYVFHEGPVVGDRAVHATSTADYRRTREMRLCASIYVSEVHEEYLDQIIDGYTQEYPPRNDPGLLLSWAGRHFRRDQPSVRLPTPRADHVLSSRSHLPN